MYELNFETIKKLSVGVVFECRVFDEQIVDISNKFNNLLGAMNF